MLSGALVESSAEEVYGTTFFLALPSCYIFIYILSPKNKKTKYIT